MSRSDDVGNMAAQHYAGYSAIYFLGDTAESRSPGAMPTGDTATGSDGTVERQIRPARRSDEINELRRSHRVRLTLSEVPDDAPKTSRQRRRRRPPTDRGRSSIRGGRPPMPREHFEQYARPVARVDRPRFPPFSSQQTLLSDRTRRRNDHGQYRSASVRTQMGERL